MNNISIRNARVTGMKPFAARGGKGLDITLCDSVGSHTVYFQFTVYDDAIQRIMNSLAVDEVINISGSIRVQIFKSQSMQSGFSVVLENPRDIYNQTRCCAVDLIEKTVPPEQEESTEDGLPF